MMVVDDGWSIFWWMAGAWNLSISIAAFRKPDVLKTHKEVREYPELYLAVGAAGLLYWSYNFIPPHAGSFSLYSIPLCAILKVLVSPFCYVQGKLTAGEFYSKQHATLWRMISLGDLLWALFFLSYFFQATSGKMFLRN